MVTLVGAAAPLFANPPIAVWNGGTGYWSDPTQWHVLPNPTAHEDPSSAASPIALIDAGNLVPSLVMVDANPTVAALHLESGDSLIIQSGRWLTIGSGLVDTHLHNAGLMRIEGGEQNAGLILNTSQPFDVVGPGILEMGHFASSQIIGTQTTLLRNYSTIAGAGVVGNGTLGVVNFHTIEATQWLDVLAVTPNSDGIENRGILQASNGGILRLTGAVNNTSGLISALDDSYVEIDGASIIGGRMMCAESGVIRATSQPASLQDVGLAGRLEVGLTRLTLRGEIKNDGIIDVVAGDRSATPVPFAEIVIPPDAADVVLGGSGCAILRWTKVFSGSTENGARLVNGPFHTIAGEGPFGANTIGILNLGTIVADRAWPLVIDPATGSEAVNEGVLRATSEMGLVLTGGSFRNNGVIEVLPGSRCVYAANAQEMNVTDSALQGGTWRVIAGDQIARIVLPAPGIIFNQADVTLSGAGSIFTLIDNMAINIGRFAIEDGRNFATGSSFFQNEGELKIGAGCQMTVQNSFQQNASGTLHIEIGQTEPGSGVMPLLVQGPASLAGTLKITIASGVVDPSSGVPIMTAQSLTGSFAEVCGPVGMTVEYQPGQIIVHWPAACPGDFNADGAVGTSDLLALISAWGACPAPPAPCSADLNHDGVVSTTDLIELLALWGPCSQEAAAR